MHTPGPWEVGPGFTVDAPSTLMVARCGCAVSAPGWSGSDFATDERKEANARLIAAAPELLEALQKLVRDADGEPDGEYLQGANKGCVAVHRSGIERAIAAIAKATGSAA